MAEKLSSAAREALRAALLQPIAPKIIPLKLFGQDVELRQPTFREVVNMRAIEDPKARQISMVIKYLCVPGTTETVFTEEDADLILEWPFGEDMNLFQNAIMELTGIHVEAADQQLRKDPLEG